MVVNHGFTFQTAEQFETEARTIRDHDDIERYPVLLLDWKGLRTR